MSNPLRDMELPDVIFCIGTNMTETHPVAATRLKKAMRNGAKLIVAVVTLRIIGTDQKTAELCHCGTGAALYAGEGYVGLRSAARGAALVAERMRPRCDNNGGEGS